MDNFEKFYTQFVQKVGSKEGPISPVITSSASFGYGDSLTGEGIFNGSVKKPLYSRVGNPTSAKLESIMTEMDGGIGAVATSSGMGAIALSVMSLIEAGDEIISVGGLFGGTYSFFTETLSRFGIKTSFFDVDEIEAIENAITPKTKILFLESVGNPNMRLPDIEVLTSIAQTHGIVSIIDNTITPLALKPLELGADIAVYSTTKIISGNASALGGCAVFRALEGESDRLNNPRYPFLKKFIKNVGAMAFIPNAKKRALRDFGMSANAHASYQTLLGLETLPLRMQRVVQSVETIVLELEKNGLHVNHPALQTHPHHKRYKEKFTHGCGTLFTIDMGTKEKAFAFLDNTTLPFITANIGDSRTLALHMSSTIYSDFSNEEKEFLGISDGLIRVSVGLENPQDIISDFVQAFQKVQ